MNTSESHPHWLPEPDRHETTFLGDVLRRETVGGSIALVAAVVAVVWANTPVADGYLWLRHLQLGPLNFEQWAGDGALTVFFFVAGLEVKREFLVGSLRRPADAAVPIAAAVCGVLVPSLIYLLVNLSGNRDGWAVPSATDIAFALAVLAVVGSSLPDQLRAFLLTLAVVDDLIVIVIIAVFFTNDLHVISLAVAVALLATYAVLQRLRVRSAVIYLPLVLGVWWAVHESGIHATIAGVALGLLTRVKPDAGEVHSPAERLEHRIVPFSAGVAVPLFAFLTAGVALSGGGTLLRDPVVIGIVLGLVLGKPLGVLGGAWLLTRFTHAELNEELAWRDVAGVAVLAGVGFTVSLLVSDLSFTGTELEAAKTAVLVGSVAAALFAALLLGRRNRLHRGD